MKSQSRTMAKRKAVLDAVHATARGLHRAGLTREQTMREFDVLCKSRSVAKRSGKGSR